VVTFLDGPAAGVVLMLRRAPLYLRAVRDSQDGEWDALDRLGDEATSVERVTVYRRVGKARGCHIRPGGRFAMADYRVLTEQPPAEVTRSTNLWRAWCWAQVLPEPGSEVT
jgi:hypothetical protein